MWVCPQKNDSLVVSRHVMLKTGPWNEAKLPKKTLPSLQIPCQSSNQPFLEIPFLAALLHFTSALCTVMKGCQQRSTVDLTVMLKKRVLCIWLLRLNKLPNLKRIKCTVHLWDVDTDFPSLILYYLVSPRQLYVVGCGVGIGGMWWITCNTWLSDCQRPNYPAATENPFIHLSFHRISLNLIMRAGSGKK